LFPLFCHSPVSDTALEIKFIPFFLINKFIPFFLINKFVPFFLINKFVNIFITSFRIIHYTITEIKRDLKWDFRILLCAFTATDL